MKIEDFCDITGGRLVFRGSLQPYIRGDIISCDPELNQLLDKLVQLGNADIPIMLRGESGCGKDLVARYAHDVSCRAQKPFLKINCAFLPEREATNELFGTGGKSGLLQQAAGGSLYIENINYLSVQTQYRFQQHIQSSAGTPNEIRYMISLHPAAESKQEKCLIEPLLYHFSSMPIIIPPLRERPADILLITLQQLSFIHEHYGVERAVGPRVMEAMLDYDWPGNTRQLISVIEQMAFMSANTRMDSIQLLQSCLSTHKQFHRFQANADQQLTTKSLKEMVLDYEIMIINQHIEQYGSLRKAATALKVSQSTLSSKLSKHYASSSKKEKAL